MYHTNVSDKKLQHFSAPVSEFHISFLGRIPVSLKVLLLSSWDSIHFYNRTTSFFDQTYHAPPPAPTSTSNSPRRSHRNVVQRVAPERVNVLYNPAFDVTDHEPVTAIVTEDGVFSPGSI